MTLNIEALYEFHRRQMFPSFCFRGLHSPPGYFEDNDYLEVNGNAAWTSDLNTFEVDYPQTSPGVQFDVL